METEVNEAVDELAVPAVPVVPVARLAYAQPGPARQFWPYLRGALIIWASIGLTHLVLVALLFGIGGRFGLPDFVLSNGLPFVGFTCVLVGAIALRTTSRQSMLLLTGTGLLLLGSIASALLDRYPLTLGMMSLLAGLQDIALPAVAVLVQIQVGDRDADWETLGSPRRLLFAAQIPASIGLACLVVQLLDLGVSPQPGIRWGVGIFWGVVASGLGTTISLVLTLCFRRTSLRSTAQILAVLYGAHLIALAASAYFLLFGVL